MARVGKFSSSSNFKPGAYFELEDNDFATFMQENKITFDKDAFHITNPNHVSNWNATMKYDRIVLQPDFTPAYVETLTQDVLEVFSDLKDSVPMRPLHCVNFRTDAVIGKAAKWAFGCDNKLQFVQLHWYQIELFYKVAHLLDYPNLWDQSGKVELLPNKKIQAQNIRAFTICPVQLFFSIASMSQDFNEELCRRYHTSPIKHGIAMDHRGFLELIKELAFERGIVIEGDCEKFDSTLIPFLFEIIKQVRFQSWDKIGMSTEEWWLRMNYNYREVLIACLAQSTGDIFQKVLGNPSGFPNTTDDNCIAHIVQQCHQVRKLTGKSFMELYRVHYRPAIYADDHIITVSQEYAPLFGPFEHRAQAYADLGMSLSFEKDYVSHDFDGHVFLGLVFRKHLGGYVPTFDVVKIQNSLLKAEEVQDPVQKFSKTRSLALLCAFQPESFSMVYKYGLSLLKRYPELSRYTMITERQAHNHWLKFESADGGFKNFENYQN